MKKTFLLIILVVSIGSSVFTEEFFTRQGVNSITLDSIQNGSYIYSANLLSNSEEIFSLVIDIFQEGKYIQSFDITPPNYTSSLIYDFYPFSDTIKFTKTDNHSVVFCFSHATSFTDAKKKDTCFSFYEIKKDKVKYISTINLSKTTLANSYGYNKMYITYNAENDRFYLAFHFCIDHKLYNYDMLLIELNADFDVTNTKRIFSTDWDKPHSIFTCNGNLYIVCDFEDLSFNNKKVIILDKNLEITQEFLIDDFNGEILCDGKNIFTVSKAGRSKNAISIKCFDSIFNEQWATYWTSSTSSEKPEIFGLYNTDEQISFQYIKQNSSDRSTKYVIFNKDGTETNFYESGLSYYPRFYFVQNQIFASNTHREVSQKENTSYIGQTSFIGIKSLSEMTVFTVEPFEEKPLVITPPSEMPPEQQEIFNKIFADINAQNKTKKLGPNISAIKLEIMTEDYDFVSSNYGLNTTKKILSYDNISPFTENFMETIPSFKMSER